MLLRELTISYHLRFVPVLSDVINSTIIRFTSIATISSATEGSTTSQSSSQSGA